MKRLTLVAILGILLVLCLLLATGPALAANPPQWGAHQVNGKFYYLSDNGAGVITFLSVASDSRVSGDLVVTVADWWDTPDGRGHSSGTYDLTNSGGSWHCPYWEAVYLRGTTVEKPGWQLVSPADAFGSGKYAGLVYRSGNHTAAGQSPYITKGWIFKQ
jgi:hypothetical protein